MEPGLRLGFILKLKRRGFVQDLVMGQSFPQAHAIIGRKIISSNQKAGVEIVSHSKTK
jgi:hypothetical protein